MADLPKVGTLIRCVGASIHAGAVTYSGHSTISLPHRTEAGKIIPEAFDAYQLKSIGNGWIYELIGLDQMRCEYCTNPVSGGKYSIAYLHRPDGTPSTGVVHTECIPAFRATNRPDFDSIETIDNSETLRGRRERRTPEPHR